MQIEDCYQLGYIIKPHGLKGQMNAFLEVDLPENYSKLESVFVEINKQLVPFTVDKIVLKGNAAILNLEAIHNFEQASQLKSSSLYLPLSSLPKLKSGQFYYHEIINFKVIDEALGDIGKVKIVYQMPNQDLLAFDYKNKEVLMPINDHTVKGIERERKELKVVLPNGLLEIYL